MCHVYIRLDKKTKFKTYFMFARTIKTMVFAILDQSVTPESKLGLCFEMMSHFWATVFGLRMFDRTL